jgi:hypothetical protein
MKILGRSQFIDYFVKEILRGEHGDLVTADSHPLWIPEHKTNIRYQYFVMSDPILFTDEYRNWCATADITTACFSTNEHSEEWWGFTTEQAAILWALKWAK